MNPLSNRFYPSPDSSSGVPSPYNTSQGSTPEDGCHYAGQAAMPQSPSNIEHPDDATVSVTFQPSFRVDDLLPDTVIVSSNHVYFYVHRHLIANVSSNGFDGRIFAIQPAYDGFLSTIFASEDGDVINVVLHTIYSLSCVHFFPSLDTVEAALLALTKYGVDLATHASAAHQPLYQLLLSHAPYRPIETYALAGSLELEELAVTISGHLLSFDLSTITDTLATKMGPVYLKRLFLLHQNRMAALRQIVLQPPLAHAPTDACTAAGEQAKLMRAWALATAQLVWDAAPSKAASIISFLASPSAPIPIPSSSSSSSPTTTTTSSYSSVYRGVYAVPEDDHSRSGTFSMVGLSANILRMHLETVGESVTCEACRKELVERIRDVVSSWSMVKATI